MTTVTAGAVIIGDEILSGKVEDTNTPLLIKVLRSVGVRLQRIVVVRDDIGDIGAAVMECAARYDHVFCSGGLGPTHDDRTVEALALAFGRPVVRHPALAQMLDELLGERLNEAALKMADVVEGTELLLVGRFPAQRLNNIFILPGVPQIFAAKLQALKPSFAATPLVMARIYVDIDESAIADQMTRVDGEHPAVQIGSYPRLDAPDYKVMITLEAEEPSQVEAATHRLLELLPAEYVVRVEQV